MSTTTPNPGSGSTARVESFLSPNSMLTPGLAGALVMMLSSTLYQAFQISPQLTALGLSCLLGLLVVYTLKVRLGIKLIYFVLNSLIIFAMAVGTGRIGNYAAPEFVPARTAGASLVASAYADDDTCRLARDGKCDDPGREGHQTTQCAPGTDRTDCERLPRVTETEERQPRDREPSSAVGRFLSAPW